MLRSKQSTISPKKDPSRIKLLEDYPRGFYQKAFHRVMSDATRGKLNLKIGDGIHTYGDANSPEVVELKVLDPEFFKHAVLHGDIGFGEGYVEELWDSEDLSGVLGWFLANGETNPTFAQSAAKSLVVGGLNFLDRIGHAFRKNTKEGSLRNISYHYDISNDLYRLMLDPTMAYSSGKYSEGINDLRAAQEKKYETICRKLALKPDLELLEVGSGWGGFAAYAARHYGCKVTTVTISRQQFDYTRELIQSEGLEDKIQVLLQDYRDIQGNYDRIVSIEMVEALGLEYHDTFFKKMNSLLRPRGIMLIQCITFPESSYEGYLKSIDWIAKHIFPGSLLLSQFEVMKSLKRVTDLNIYSIESLGLSYARTLHAWAERFNANLDAVRELGFDETFIRLWNYYLAYCEVGFASRYINDVHIVFSRSQNTELPDG
ncbi:MAG: cyclopropane-fatty-acyl-phospholipid synthase [Leptospiraceae bacterium]|nr:cyclopropane-fatty-acyl-phospholipid synthase [Leptospiraceae bacterium]